MTTFMHALGTGALVCVTFSVLFVLARLWATRKHSLRARLRLRGYRRAVEARETAEFLDVLDLMRRDLDQRQERAA